jgi:hypothetical protein
MHVAGEKVVAEAGRGPLLHASAIASYILIWRNSVLSLSLIPRHLIRQSGGVRCLVQ